MRDGKVRVRLCAATVGALMVLGGCSGSTEDVRVTLCKNLVTSLQTQGSSIEWTGGENTFNRPSFAITGLDYEVAAAGGDKRSGKAGCYYAYTALEDTALDLANPLNPYDTLPFAMTVDGRALSDAELLRLVNAEQKRLGRKAVATIEDNAKQLADKVRAGIGN